MNKKRIIFPLIAFLVLGFISACGTTSGQSDGDSSIKDKIVSGENKSKDNSNESDDNDGTNKKSAEAEDKIPSSNTDSTTSDDNSDQDENTSDDSIGDNENDALSVYSAEEIEYARVWLQVIDNKATGELNVQHISAGEQVNPYDDDSVGYPEDVISLGGEAMADGVVTYSGNGDGTINLYDIPSHFPSAKQIDESMKDYTQDIIDNPKKVSIDPGDDEEVEELIRKLNIAS